MSRMKKWLPLWILLAALALMWVFASMRSKPPQRPDAPRVAVVEVIIATEAPVSFEVSAQGSVQPRTQTTLVSEVGGTVLETAPKFVVGSFFKAGEWLLTVDPKDYRVAVLRTEAAVANRRALLAQESARAEQAGRDWATLNRPGQPSELVLRKPFVAEAEANVRSAEADLAAARINLERTRVRAPFDGLLIEKRADLGQYVNQSAPIAVLAATDFAEVRLPISEADLAVLRMPGDAPVAVRLLARAGAESHEWQAELARTEGVLDERTRLMPVVVEVRDPYALAKGADARALKFGSFVEARLPAQLGQPAMAVPRRALRGLDQLLIAAPDDTLLMRTVDILRSDQAQLYVGAGLAAGERVITTSVEAPVAGMPLRVVDAAARRMAPDDPAAAVEAEPAR